MTDDSAFKKQVRSWMAETGEKYTMARRMVIAGNDPGQPPVVVRVYLNPHVDVELTAEAGRAYAAADEQGRREMAARLLMDEIEASGTEDTRVAAGSKIVTDHQLRTEAEAAQDAAIRDLRDARRGVHADSRWRCQQQKYSTRGHKRFNKPREDESVLLRGPRCEREQERYKRA